MSDHDRLVELYVEREHVLAELDVVGGTRTAIEVSRRLGYVGGRIDEFCAQNALGRNDRAAALGAALERCSQ